MMVDGVRVCVVVALVSLIHGVTSLELKAVYAFCYVSRHFGHHPIQVSKQVDDRNRIGGRRGWGGNNRNGKQTDE